MDAYILILRVLHVLSAIFWVGATFFTLGFLMPTVEALGPDGGKFMQTLAQRTRITLAMNTAGIIAVVSGVLLYERVSGGFSSGYLDFARGQAITIGAIAGIIAGAVGFAINGRTGKRLAEISREMQGPPTPEQAVEMGALQQRLKLGSQITSAFMLIAIVGMSIADAL